MKIALQPISPELRAWLAAQLAAGHAAATLRQSMRDAGWHDDAVEAALAECDAAGRGRRGRRQADRVPARRSAMPGPDLRGAPLYLDAGDRRVHVLQTLKHAARGRVRRPAVATKNARR